MDDDRQLVYDVQVLCTVSWITDVYVFCEQPSGHCTPWWNIMNGGLNRNFGAMSSWGVGGLYGIIFGAVQYSELFRFCALYGWRSNKQPLATYWGELILRLSIHWGWSSPGCIDIEDVVNPAALTILKSLSPVISFCRYQQVCQEPASSSAAALYLSLSISANQTSEDDLSLDCQCKFVVWK